MASPHLSRILREEARGEFAWWEAGLEEKWKAAAPPKPAAPTLHATYGIIEASKVAVMPSSGVIRCLESPVRTWDAAIEMGRDYLCGKQTPLKRYLKSCTSVVTAWQKQAYEWACQNIHYKLLVETPGKEWEVLHFGEYVEFRLPHQDLGGEKTYISRNNKSKVLVNQD